MLYLFIKYLHILSSTILFGTGLGIASVMLYAHLTKEISVIAAIARYVVLADWVFTSTSALLQPLTGFCLVYLAGFSYTQLWLWGSILGYVIAACCWLPVVYLQLKMRDMAINALDTKSALPPQYYRYFRYWFYLGWPAFISLLIVFYLMTAKPF